MDPKTDKLVRRTTIGATVVAAYLLLTADYGPNPNVLDPEVIDTSGGCGASFAIEIVSEQFEGKRLLEKHRLVNSALAEQMKDIHALSIKKALTPAQWQPQDGPKKA